MRATKLSDVVLMDRLVLWALTIEIEATGERLLETFQRLHGLEATGVLDEETRVRIVGLDE